MATITVEVDDKLFENIQKEGIDVQSEINDFLYDLVDDGYPAISTEEAKKRVSRAVEDYRKNGMKNCEVVDDKFWDDVESRLIQRHKKVS
jgi:hypothetical protein